MRRGLQLAVLGAFTVPGVVMLAPGAWAQPLAAAGTQSAKPGVLQTAWFWQTAYQQVNPPVAPPAAPPTEPSGVPSGDLAVANTSTDGSSSKMSVIAFHVDALKPGATVNSFTMSIALDPNGTQVNSSSAPVLACLPTRLWTPAQGGSYTNEPTVDCGTKAAPKIKGDTYTFTITDIAQQWIGGPNLGVALVNDPANTAPFQAVFSAKSIATSMRYTLPVTTPPPARGNGGLGGNGSGSGNGAPAGAGAGTTSSSGSVAAPPPGPVTLPPSGPTTTTTPADTGAQAPVVATTQPVAAPIGKPASSTPNTAFWIGAIAVAVLVVVAGAVLADDRVPAPTATTTRLGRVLRDRERHRQAGALPTATSTAAGASDATPTLFPRRV